MRTRTIVGPTEMQNGMKLKLILISQNKKIYHNNNIIESQSLHIVFVCEKTPMCVSYNGAMLSSFLSFDSFADFEYSSENLEFVLKNGPLLKIPDHTRVTVFPIF